jgi:hypothetical protein
MAADAGSGFYALLLLLIAVLIGYDLPGPFLLNRLFGWITDRKLQMIVLALPLIAGYIPLYWLSAYAGGPFTLIAALLFVCPFAVFIPLIVYPGLGGENTWPGNVAIAFLVTLLCGAFLVLGPPAPAIAAAIAPAGGLITGLPVYAGLIVLDTFVAYAVYRILQRWNPRDAGMDERHP